MIIVVLFLIRSNLSKASCTTRSLTVSRALVARKGGHKKKKFKSYLCPEFEMLYLEIKKRSMK
jgi:hypothetical protein